MRNGDSEGRTASAWSNARPHRYLAIVSLDDLLRQSEPEPSSPICFRRKERLEEPGVMRGLDTMAVICNYQMNVSPPLPQTDGQGAILRQCVNRVHNQI